MHAMNGLETLPPQRNGRRLPRHASRIAESIEREAWRDIVHAGIGAAPQLDLEAQGLGHALILRSRRLDSLLFNRVIGFGHSGVVTDHEIEAILRGYRDRGVDRYWIHVDECRSGDLPDRLDAHGLECHARRWTKFMRDVEPYDARPSPLGLRPATAADAAAVAEIVAPAFDMPAGGGIPFAALIGRFGWHVFVATDRDRIAAVAGLYVSGHVGYHAFAATRPDLRNQGAQSGLIAARIQTARKLGCKWLVTETGAPRAADEANPSYQNIERSGFAPVGRRLNFGLPGTTWTAAGS